uniref:Stc1 domain-containing protein n=1 Tax=Tetradesmus obliquus TaxID=3088 RepID=A0A383VID7_TETOB|eukprot:jgi/Sobl393_1/19973/SZX64599.1
MESRICKMCNESKPLTKDFFGVQVNKRKDGTPIPSFRRDCNLCRVTKVQAAKDAKKGHKTPSNTPMPSACSNTDCQCPPEELEFAWRKDAYDWRTECKACVAERTKLENYSAKSRAKCKAADPEGFLAHNNEVHQAWMSQNPEKRKQYQAAQAASADARLKAIAARNFTSGAYTTIPHQPDMSSLLCQALITHATAATGSAAASPAAAAAGGATARAAAARAAVTGAAAAPAAAAEGAASAGRSTATAPASSAVAATAVRCCFV